MPKFSIVIPTYNAEEYLSACLDSLIQQNFNDWEAIVVIDASPDASLKIAQHYAAHDSRINIIDLSQNMGLHLARKAGVEHIRGDYALFLDADDEFAPGFLSGLASYIDNHPSFDIVHFGLIPIAHDDSVESMISGFTSQANRPFPPLSEEKILRTVFCESENYLRDWRVTQRAIKSSLVKQAFSLMKDERLERAEDAYEYFVIASLAHTEGTHNELVGYVYNIGRGVTNGRPVDINSFSVLMASYRNCYQAILDYSQNGPSFWLDAASGLKNKILEAMGNDWHEKLPNSEKIQGAAILAQLTGPLEAATQVARCARDEAYELWANPKAKQDTANITSWLQWAEQVTAPLSFPPDSPYQKYRTAALNHLNDVLVRLEGNMHIEAMSKESIRVFVSTHKRVDLFDSNILQPVQVGSLQAPEHFVGHFHDDEGENISHLNQSYCELTTQYWAWKNIDAEYYGFCHYRRYFDFSTIQHQENCFGEVLASRIDPTAQVEYGLTDDIITSAIEGCDLVTTRIQDLRTFPGDYNTPRSQYDAAPHLRVEDLDHIMALVIERYPDYRKDVETFMQGNYACFCNMFIMKQSLFHEYCSWLFPILEEFTKNTDTTFQSKERLRTPGHLAERLLNVYILHLKRTRSDIVHKEMQCVHFEHPESACPLSPLSAQSTQYRPVIPVVFAADDSYVPMLATTICSLLENSSKKDYYDIVILERNISASHKKVLSDFIEKYENASLRFVWAEPYIHSYNLSTNNEHISIETYYRFLIQDILPFYDKVIYLDSDLIIHNDISNLYKIDLCDNLVGAVRDVDYLGNLNMKNGERYTYTENVLKLSNPYSYFQAGVLLLNTKAMRSFYPITRWLEIASDPIYIYNDQDVLNAHCQNRVTYLDYNWNVMHDCGHRVQNVFSFAPSNVYDAYLSSRQNPYIVHYAGYEKPWKNSSCDFAELYWFYARKTPFYEALFSMTTSSHVIYPDLIVPLHERALSEDSKWRAYIDPLAPIGSLRREMIKSAARFFQGKK